MPSAKLTPASKAAPCPVCGGDHKCSTTADGLILCGRTQGTVAGFRHLGPCKDGTWHKYRAVDAAPSPRRLPLGPPAPPPDFDALSRESRTHFTADKAADLGRRLGLPADHLWLLGTGFDPATGNFTFPCHSGDGRVCGVALRLPDDAKRMVPGSKLGLYLPGGFADAPGPLFLVEGPTDALALTAVGLPAVGRPSNRGGGAELAVLMRRQRAGRPLVVVGDNDQKPDGSWPGKEGAVQTATDLAAALGRPVGYVLPPAGIKDARDWVGRLVSDGRDPEAIGRHLAGEWSRAVEDIPPPAKTHPAPGEYPYFVPAGQLAADASGVPWLWDGLLARDAVTVLAALPKCGKTTLVQHLLAALPTGGEFCGRRLLPGRACVVSEEAASVWAMRVRDNLPPDTGVIARGRLRLPDLLAWEGFLTFLAHKFETDPCDLVVFDTLASLWPVKDENNATDVTAALRPLHRLTQGRSVLLVHHLRKSDGAEGTGSRGSGALAGFVDITAELRRAKPDPTGKRRTLTTYGRYDPTLADWTVELTPAGYKHVPTESRPERADALLAFLPAAGEGGVTAKEVWERMDPGGRPSDPKHVQTLLRECAGVRVDGRGVRGAPLRFSRTG